jgi:hypothetical protein
MSKQLHHPLPQLIALSHSSQEAPAEQQAYMVLPVAMLVHE